MERERSFIMLRRIICYALAAWLSCAWLLAIDSADVKILRKGGKYETRLKKLEKVGEGVWRLKIPTCEIPRDALKIDVVSSWATASKGDAGYFVTSDGHLGTFREDNGKYCSRKNMLKLYGMKGPKGCFVAIMKGLAFEQNLHVEAKDGKYAIFPRYNIDKIEFDPYEDIVIDFYELKGDDANYSGMARTYRKYQLGRGEVVPLKERAKNNPTLDFAAKSIYVRIKAGRCDRRAYPRELWGKREFPLVVDNTFDGIIDIMKRMKSMGIDWAEVCLVGWHKGGHDGPFPDLFPVPEEFGGEKKMLEAIREGKSLGYRMTVHVNHTSFYYGKAKRLPLEDVCKGPDGKARKYTFWPGGQAYFSCYQTLCNRLLDADLSKFKSMGLNGTFHVDVTSAREPTPCHDPMHPNNRKQMADWQNRVNKKCRDAFGAYSSECAFDHVAKTLDYGLYVSWQGSESLKFGKLIDRPIPLTELVYHGIILTNPFYGTIDAPYERGEDKFSDVKESYAYLGSAANRMLKVIEFGGRPSFYYIDYKDLSPMKGFYDEYQKLKHLQFEFMDSHEEVAKGVFSTTYSDGTCIVCNYRDEAFDFKGKSIKPKSYIVLY